MPQDLPATLDALWERHPVVRLVGPPGSGKRALARRWLGRHAHATYLGWLALYEDLDATPWARVARDRAERSGSVPVRFIALGLSAAVQAVAGADPSADLAVLDTLASAIDAGFHSRLYRAVAAALAGEVPERQSVLAAFEALPATHRDALTTAVVGLLKRTGEVRCRVDLDGQWFSVGGGERVSLSRRKVLARLLAELAQAHRDHRRLDGATLQARVWPDEAMVGDSGRNRAYASVRLLRKAGLGELIVSSGDGGYHLAPAVRVVG